MAKYGVFYEINYSGADAITIQQPVGGGKSVQFAQLRVFASTAATIQIERDGTPASSAAQGILTINPFAEAAASALSAFKTSNVGAGTIIDKIDLQANAYREYDLSEHFFGAAVEPGKQSNITFKINSAGTPNVRLQVIWDEGRV